MYFMVYFTVKTKPPIAHAILIRTKIANRYKILRFVMRVTFDTLEGFLLEKFCVSQDS
jgi:hypothetical protein